MLRKCNSSKQNTLRQKTYSLCLGNISGNFSANNMKKKAGLNGCVYDFSVDYRAFDNSKLSIFINI